MSNELTRVFRALYFPHRRREIDGTTEKPINTQPGEIIFDELSNKLYATRDDGSVVLINSNTPEPSYSSSSSSSGSPPDNSIIDGGIFFTSSG